MSVICNLIKLFVSINLYMSASDLTCSYLWSTRSDKMSHSRRLVYDVNLVIFTPFPLHCLLDPVTSVIPDTINHLNLIVDSFSMWSSVNTPINVGFEYPSGFILISEVWWLKRRLSPRSTYFVCFLTTTVNCCQNILLSRKHTHLLCYKTNYIKKYIVLK